MGQKYPIFPIQNGSGGRSAFDEAPLFLAEQCPLKDHKVYLVLQRGDTKISYLFLRV